MQSGAFVEADDYGEKMNGRIPSLFELFTENIEFHGDQPAFMIAAGDRAIPISWAQFVSHVESVSWAIHKYLGEKVVVGILGENSYEWMVLHAACLFGDAVAVPLDTTLSAGELAERLRFVGARLVVHSSLFTEKAQDLAKLLPGVTFKGFGSIDIDGLLVEGVKAARDGYPSIFAKPRDENEVCSIVFTSGTTSKPRGVELTLANFAVFAASANLSFPIKRRDRTLMVLPLTHIFGICAAYCYLAHGVAMGVCPDFRRIFDAVHRFRADHIFLVPALAEILAQKISMRGTSVEAALGKPVRWIGTGGAMLPRRTYERLTELGIHVCECYGLTETCAVYSMDDYLTARPGTIGRMPSRIPGVETKISGDGELLIRGACVMRGYYLEPEKTAEKIVDGWFHTGDRATVDEEGYIRIVGRINRTIVLSSGKKIAPEELEAKLLQLPGFLEVVVSGDNDSREFAAEVYANVPDKIVREEIDALNKMMPIYKRIRIVKIRKEPFPRTSSGKIKV